MSPAGTGVGLSLFPSTSNPRPPSAEQRMSPQSIRGDAAHRPTLVTAAGETPRSETAFSEAGTLVRSSSNRSRSSIAKPPASSEYSPRSGTSASYARQPLSRSIFPAYDQHLSLDQQPYYPTRAGPAHIPRSVISRPLYSPPPPAPMPSARTPSVPILRSPTSIRARMGRTSPDSPPPQAREPPTMPPISTTEDLRDLWKVANGWRAPPSEGRVYCLRLTTDKDAPVYTLSSATQPFYSLRLDPTSTSAYVTLSRYDPHKPYKGAPPPVTGASSSSSSPSAPAPASDGGGPGTRPEHRHWHEALATTLESDSRRLPPGDGLAALLYPRLAARLAQQRPDDPAAVAVAEAECARLEWDAAAAAGGGGDGDGQGFLLAHPALALPFRVVARRNGALSRAEWALEHAEWPQCLARLTRDATGAGWLEVDTAVAALVDAAYLVDVAVAALVLAAHKDGGAVAGAVFEPPPVWVREGRRAGWGGGGSGGGEAGWGKTKKKKKKKKKGGGGGAGPETARAGRRRMEEFEIDVESQGSPGGKPAGRRGREENSVPGVVRGVATVLTVVLKCLLWLVTVVFRVLAAIVARLARWSNAEKR